MSLLSFLTISGVCFAVGYRKEIQTVSLTRNGAVSGGSHVANETFKSRIAHLAGQDEHAAKRVVLSLNVSHIHETSVAFHQTVVEESSDGCVPDGCTYRTIYDGWWFEQNHKKLGEGHFAETLLVTNESNKSATQYVWKRFKEANKIDTDEDQMATFAANAKMIRQLGCDNTLAPRDVQPIINHVETLWTKTYKGNGIVTEKMDGDVEHFSKEQCTTQSCKCSCGNKLFTDILKALLCLRQPRAISDRSYAGFLHTDVKLDNVLFKKTGEQCPDFKLADFDLLIEVGKTPTITTPPLGRLMNITIPPLYEKLATLKGFEDVAALAISYKYDWRDKTVKSQELLDFLKFAQKNLGPDAGSDIPKVDEFPPLGCFGIG